ncbi:helix-turn-helix transcriptional regulator [Microlunatus soli]|uniref:Helix-turn-helix domain-containing protein n=1 Tax=Microlunatus soli TaxID=630515 RepID=A0A1H1SG04_9ACTN|nr:helix-turn-helix transcriptional regulator [Microlunatus soli]SDS46892.1 Helix-turn-helix domain-containing protein [Microlunatus soli]
MTTDSRRAELGAFLRSRRERMTPERAGIPRAGRRRTPGLRREEVAQLAGVGVTWYTWLEQGRPINASTQVLDAVGRILELDPAERDHVRRLSGNAPLPTDSTMAEGAGTPADIDTLADVDTLLQAVEPLPAVLVNDRTDIVRWNETYRTVNPGLIAADPHRRNTVWDLFVGDRGRGGAIIDGDERASQVVAAFRYRYGHHIDDPAWRGLIDRLCRASPPFARLWATKDVARPGLCNKVHSVPGVGTVTLRPTGMELTDRPGLRLVVYTPADDQSRERLDRLLHRASA